jgi:hypothetical protein
LKISLPFIDWEGFERRAELHAGIVDEDVDRADLRLDIGNGGAARLGIGDIEGGADGVAIAATDILGGRFRLLRVAAVDDDGSAMLGKPDRQRAADALAGAGDKGAAAGEVEEIRGHEAAPLTGRKACGPRPRLS